MEMMSPTDAMFLVGESREHPMHVAGLQLFEPPAGRRRRLHARSVRGRWSSMTTSSPRSASIPATLLGGFANVGWTFDDDIDIDYHLRRSALPRPAGSASCSS